MFYISSTLSTNQKIVKQRSEVEPLVCYGQSFRKKEVAFNNSINKCSVQLSGRLLHGARPLLFDRCQN